MPLVKMSEINKKQESTPSGLIPMGSLSQDSQEEDQPQIKSTPTNFLNIEKSPLIQQINDSKKQNNNDDFRTDYPGGYWNPLNDLGHLANSSIVRSLDNAAGRAMGIPSDLVKSTKPTGSKGLDTALNFVGQGAGYLTNPAQIEQNVGKVFFDNPLVNKASGKIGSLVDDGLARLTGSNVAQTLEGRIANKIAEGATNGAVGAASYAPFQTLNSGGDVQDIPHNVLEQGLMGAAFGAAGGAAGSLIKSGIKSMKDIVGGSKGPPLPDYSNVQVSSGRGKNNPVAAEPKDTMLHADPFNGEPIRLTPQEIARNERIDRFSKIEENPTIPETMDQIQSKTGRDSVPLVTRANEAYIKGVDNLHRINQFDQVAKDANGGELKPTDSAYILGLNARGHDMQASQIINRNLIDSKGEVVGPPLAHVTEQIPKGKEAEFNDYTVAKHSISRMKRGEKVYKDNKEMTIQKAQAIVDRYDISDPEFKNLAKQSTEFSHNFAQKWYVDTGLMKQSQLDGYREANPNYVSNKRIFSDLENQSQFGSSRGGIVGQTLPVKRAPGSQRQIVNPIESSIEDVARGVKTAKQNEAGQAIVRSLERNPDELKGFAEIVHDQPKLDVNKLIEEEGPEGLIDHINREFDQATNNPNLEKGNVVTVLVKGEPVHVRIFDPQLLEAVSNLSPKGQDYVTAFVGKGTKVMKNLTTGINPIFGLTRNIFRDIPHAYISSKTTVNPIRYGTDLLDAMTSVLADSASHSKMTPNFMKGWLEARGKLYNDYKNMGGGHSSPTASDRNLLAQTKEKLIPSSGMKESLKRNLLTRPYHMLENINNAAEASPRLGEFKRIAKEGDYDSKVKALYEANDLTVNFNKYGNVTKNVDAYLPYLNAAVQGLDQVVRMYSKGGPKRLAQVYAKSIGALTIPTTILYLINHDNPDYQQMSNFTKDNFLLIPNNDGTFTKIAKPRELGMVFSTGVERALKSFLDHDPEAFKDFGHNFLENFLPPGVSGAVNGFEDKGVTGILPGVLGDTILGPVQSLASNKDFAGRPIVPGDLAKLSPQLQYDSKTSEPSKFIGKLTNTSPKQLDYLVKSYGGVLGSLGVPLTTNGGSIKDTLKQQVTADPAYSNDISRNFYDEKAKYDMKKADAKSQGDVSEDAGLTKYFTKVTTQISRIRKLMDYVQKDDSITNADKKAQLRELQIQISDLQNQSLKQLEATR